MAKKRNGHKKVALVLLLVSLIGAGVFLYAWQQETVKTGSVTTISPWITYEDEYGQIQEIDPTSITTPVAVLVKVNNVTVSSRVTCGFYLTTTATIGGETAAGKWTLTSCTISQSKPTKSNQLITDWGGERNLGSKMDVPGNTAYKSELEGLGTGTHTSTISISGKVSVTTSSPEVLSSTKNFSWSYNITIEVTASTLTIIVNPEAHPIIN